MPTYSVRTPTEDLGMYVADCAADAVSEGLASRPDVDVMAGLTVELMGDLPVAESYTLWQTHGEDGEPLGFRHSEGVFEARPQEVLTTGSLATAVERLGGLSGSGHIQRGSDGAVLSGDTFAPESFAETLDTSADP